MVDNFAKIKKKRNIGIIMPEGEIVFENSNPHKEEVKSKITEDEDIDKLIVDLGQVPYLDSSGVGYLISLLKFMRQGEGELVLSNLDDKVQRVIKLTKLEDIIDIYESNEEAMEDLT